MHKHNSEKKKSPPKTAVLLLTMLLVGFLLGASAPYKDWLLWDRFQTMRFALFCGTLMEPTPRNVLFETFSPKADVVMIGDSVTSAGEWSEIFPDVKIANRGISGETAEDILQRMAPIFAVQPKMAFLMVGINDIYDGQSIDSIFGNYVNIVEQLRTRNITVYMQSTIECSIDKCGDRIDKVRELNRRLEAYAVEHGITFIDLNAGLSSESQGLLKDYTYDGMHLSAQGFVQWKAMIKAYVNLHTAQNPNGEIRDQILAK